MEKKSVRECDLYGCWNCHCTEEGGCQSPKPDEVKPIENKPMKETPEETYDRVINLIPDDQITDRPSYFDVAKLYHKERLKQELPSDEEIESMEYFGKEVSGFDWRQGIRYLKNKLLNI